MKTSLIASILLLIGVFSYAQIEIEVNSHTEGKGLFNKGVIEISVTQGEPEYTYYVFSDYPWNNGETLFQSNSTTKEKYTFAKLKKGRYIILVMNSEKVSSKMIEVILD